MIMPTLEAIKSTLQKRSASFGREPSSRKQKKSKLMTSSLVPTLSFKTLSIGPVEIDDEPEVIATMPLRSALLMSSEPS